MAARSELVKNAYVTNSDKIKEHTGLMASCHSLALGLSGRRTTDGSSCDPAISGALTMASRALLRGAAGKAALSVHVADEDRNHPLVTAVLFRGCKSAA